MKCLQVLYGMLPRQQIKDSLQELKNLETKHMEFDNPKLLDQIKLTKQNLNKIYDSQEEKKAKFIQQRYYDNGPRAKKLFAWRYEKATGGKIHSQN